MGTAEVATIYPTVPGYNDFSDYEHKDLYTGKAYLWGGTNVPTGERSIPMTQNKGTKDYDLG